MPPPPLTQPLTAAATKPVVDRNLHLLPQTRQLRALHTIVRDHTVRREDFVLHSGRIIRLLLESALDLLPYRDRSVRTPVGQIYPGLVHASELCGVSIARAGESMESELRAVLPGVPIGKILIQRDRVTKLPHVHFSLLPEDIGSRGVLLLDPMLATGGTALAAIELLVRHGVPEENIWFVCFLAVEPGIAAVRRRYPNLPIVTSAIDQRLNENAYMVPGIGDFGDRYFGTERTARAAGGTS